MLYKGKESVYDYVKHKYLKKGTKWLNTVTVEANNFNDLEEKLRNKGYICNGKFDNFWRFTKNVANWHEERTLEFETNQFI